MAKNWRNLIWVALVFFLAISLFTFACSGDDDDDDNDDDNNDDTGDSGDDDDDDAGDDDDDNDDTGDDDDDDTAFSCEKLTEAELNLFRNVFCAGASYSNSVPGSPPLEPDDLSKTYHGKIIEKAWENLGACVDYVPEFWIYWYDEVNRIKPEATISLSVDGFFWILSGNVEASRQNVSNLLDGILVNSGVSDDFQFIGAVVPKQLMIMAGIISNREELVQMIKDEVNERDQASAIMFDYYFEKLLAGKVIYDGEQIGFFDVIQMDFLHATEFGHQLIADLYIEELNRLYPNLMIETWGEVVILD